VKSSPTNRLGIYFSAFFALFLSSRSSCTDCFPLFSHADCFPLFSQAPEGSHDNNPPLTCKCEWGVYHHFPSGRCHGSLTTSRACVPFFSSLIIFCSPTVKLPSISPLSRGFAPPSRSPSLPSPDIWPPSGLGRRACRLQVRVCGVQMQVAGCRFAQQDAGMRGLRVWWQRACKRAVVVACKCECWHASVSASAGMVHWRAVAAACGCRVQVLACE
jgi:hypothetical protein